ncbi:ATP-binding protein [Carboxylicivirga taeanensis]|uniref:sensor histidine kinase n=1 Tax=Carboxylicivirga taeanensis TaxID=1416875 RepID=UPI003F6DF3BA
MRYLFLTILVTLIARLVPINGANHKFYSYNLDNGLSSSTVACFFQSENGLIWIGTGKGVDLFTGSEFIPLHHFTKDTAHTTNTLITAINELHENTLWAGTWGDGLFSVNIETGEYKHYRHSSSSANTTVSDNYINCIEVFDNQLWIGTNYCLNQTDGNGHFVHYNFKEVLTRTSADIRAIIPRHTHLLSIFTDAGEIIELNSQTGAYKKVGEVDTPLKSINKVQRDQYGRYWIGTTYQGLIVLDENYQMIELPSRLQAELGKANISDIVAHSEYGMFVGSDGQGLYIINPVTLNYQLVKESNRSSSLSSNQVESLNLDANGLLWVGYYKEGFSTTLIKSDGIVHYLENNTGNNLPDKNVNCFTEDAEQNIWIGTEKGLSIFDHHFNALPPQRIHKQALSLLKGVPVTALSTNKDSSIVYVGTYNQGLFCVNLSNGQVSTFNKANSLLESNFIRDVKSFNDSINYIATIDGGLYKFDGRKLEKIKVFHQNNFEILDFLDIQIIDQENIWLSSVGNGIMRINTATGSGEVFHTVASTINYSCCQTSDSAVFVATNMGVYEYSAAQNDFTSITAHLSNIDFYGILEQDTSFLWISSSDGLFRYNRNTKFLEKINSINLQGREFLPGAYFKTSDNRLLFGGTNNFNIIQPQNFTPNTDGTSLFISELKIYNQTIKPGEPYNENLSLPNQVNYTPKLTIPSNIDLFSITVKAINYLSAEKNRIAYTIERGQKTSNVFYTEGEIAFLNMKPGFYKLNIYPVSNRNKQIISSAIKQITIQKQIPWWRSAWIYIALFVVIVGIITILNHVRVKEYRKTKRLLQEKVTERTATLLSQKERLQQQKNELQEMLDKNKRLESFKENIISMIVHDLKNPLNGIIGLTSLNEAQYLEQINSASRQMLCLVENILDVRRYETHSLQLFYQQCNIRQVVNEAIDDVSFLLKGNQIEIVNQCTSIDIEADKDILRRVYINLLTNAIKYTQPNGKITLRCQLKSETAEKIVLLSVQDEGSGIPGNFKDSIFDLYQQVDTKKSGRAYSNGLGLSFCKIAVNEHQGKIWVESELGKGSSFFMELPVQKPNS